MIDSIDGLPTQGHGDATKVEVIRIDEHLMTQLPRDIWRHFPKLQHLNLPHGLLTDYPVEIEQIPTLQRFDLNDNPLTPEAITRYVAFQGVLEERKRQQNYAKRIAKAKEKAVAAGDPDNWKSWLRWNG